MVYQGNLNYHGADTLQVLSTDTGSATDTDTVNITVNSVNDAPLGTDGAVTTDEDTPYTFTQSDFGFTDVDVPDSLSARADRYACRPRGRSPCRAARSRPVR